MMQANLDRFSWPLWGERHDEAKAICAGCKENIFSGEDVYVVDGYILHADWECLYRYMQPECMPVEDALGGGR